MPKETLNKIAPEKRERVLLEAARLFAQRGFAQTDMAKLARRAKVSKGSLYDYFDGKEDLYLSVCRDGLERSRRYVYGDILPDWNIYRTVRHIFERGLDFAEAHPEFVMMYLNVSTPGMERFAMALSQEVEQATAALLKDRIREGIEQGFVRNDLNANLMAYLINSMYIMLMASCVSQHYRIRIQEYLNLEEELTAASLSEVGDQLVNVIERFLKP